ncbi:MAG: hypothetical protein J7K13_02285, partial [Thermoplasmata archaeon]|nr:hypothetical protein [Thermoplasmata archaeon]
MGILSNPVKDNTIVEIISIMLPDEIHYLLDNSCFQNHLRIFFPHDFTGKVAFQHICILLTLLLQYLRFYSMGISFPCCK